MLRLSMGRLFDIVVGHLREAVGGDVGSDGNGAGAGVAAATASNGSAATTTSSSKSSSSGDGAVISTTTSGGGGGGSSASGDGSSDRQLPKMFIYSGHDSTILPLLLAFGVDIEAQGWPPYLSTMCVLTLPGWCAWFEGGARWLCLCCWDSCAPLYALSTPIRLTSMRLTNPPLPSFL